MAVDQEKVLMTKEGHQALLNEYKKLIEKDRPAVVKAIQDARAMGDLSENGMYTGAREKQSFLEGRIKEVEDLLKRAEVVSIDTKKGIGLGSSVLLETQTQKVEYTIVGAEEVDFTKNKISHQSPLGQALIGKKVGDSFDVVAPVGIIKYKIIEIK